MTKILIADDYQPNRAQLTAHLGRHGLTVLQAATLEEAVETAAREQPAVAILDSDTQSEIDGFVAVKAIKETAPQTKIILLVTATHIERLDEARRVGADVVLVKDTVSLNDLDVAVTNLIARAKD